jgi:hypothetical protein
MARGINDEYGAHLDDAEGHDLGEVEVLFANPKSIKVQAADGPVLIPISQLHANSEITGDEGRGERGKLVVTKWLARERGWLDADGEPAVAEKPKGRTWFGMPVPPKEKP